MAMRMGSRSRDGRITRCPQPPAKVSPMPSGSLPSVAICIPTYNQADFLERAVDSALRQDYAGPVEVWVADDASTDDTPSLLARLREAHPALEAIRQEANLGI